jgi:hypothetical protein
MVVEGTMPVAGMSVVVVTVSPISSGMCGGVDGIVGLMVSQGSGR